MFSIKVVSIVSTPLIIIGYIIDSLHKIQLKEENIKLKEKNEQLEKENEHLDKENDLQAEHYAQLLKGN